MSAEVIMPIYNEYADDMSPEEFIKSYWNFASDGLRGEMIEYIEDHPFDGCARYIEQWIAFVDHNRGRVLSLI